VLKAIASHPTGVIDKVEFFSSGWMIGYGTLSGPNTYTLKWKEPPIGHHKVSAIAIDGSGIPTLSTPVKFRIDTAPEVAITSPTDAARFTAWINVPEGQYTLKAVAMSESEASGTSKPVTIRVENPVTKPSH
jgi:hypothetical protein